MKKITIMVGAVVAIIVLTGTTYGLALRSTVEEAVTENAPMRGLILKVSKDLQAERLKLARSRAKLREFPRRQKQWDAKLTSIEAQISSTKEQIAAGLSLVETGEQAFDVGGNRYTKQQLELDLSSKADMLRSLRERKKSAVETLKAIEGQQVKSTAIIAQSETAVAKLDTRLQGLSAENDSLALLRDLNVLLPDASHLFDSSPIIENMNEIDTRLDVFRQLLDGHRSQSGGVNYVEPRESEIDLEAIKTLLN